MSQFARYNKIDVGSIIALYDDIDVPLGKVKIREAGGHGGHNGIRSLIEHLSSDAFARIKLGVGRPTPDYQGAVSDWVLGNFSSDELKLLAETMYKDVMERLQSIVKQRAAK